MMGKIIQVCIVAALIMTLVSCSRGSPTGSETKDLSKDNDRLPMTKIEAPRYARTEESSQDSDQLAMARIEALSYARSKDSSQASDQLSMAKIEALSYVRSKDSSPISAWVVYWDLLAGEMEMKKMEQRLEKLSVFAAYFDAKDQLFIPQELAVRRQQFNKGNTTIYLTVVNDRQNNDGTVTTKDIDVLRRVLANDESMESHSNEIVQLAREGCYDGIELDYEKFWKDASLSRSFIIFADMLFVKAMKNNLKLRIVLEPNAPFDSPYFAVGPEYVVMLYNLHGLHNGPGPKADRTFIQKTIKRMKALLGEKAAAIASGGAVWADNGAKKMLTEAEATKLAVSKEAQISRDNDSQGLVFSYQDQGVQYQVWYADVHTLNFWIAAAREQGEIGINLWRLGGNIDIQQIK